MGESAAADTAGETASSTGQSAEEAARETADEAESTEDAPVVEQTPVAEEAPVAEQAQGEAEVTDTGDSKNPAAAQDKTAADDTTDADGQQDDSAAADTGSSDNSETKNESDDSGKDNDEPHGFEGLGLPDAVLEAVKKVGYEQPSAIQAATIPHLMEGRDVVGLAQTGTGKTAAFALPILAGIDRSVKAPQALILAPTRELALQVADSFQSFADHLGRISVLPIYGGQAYGVQLSGLRRGAQIIVGTPGRVIDHLKKGSLDISGLRFMVLDEADEMLNMGFQEDVERILEDTPEDKQVALFSATMPNGIRRIAQNYLTNPKEITVKSTTRTATNIKQRYLYVAHRNKLDALTRILEVTEIDGMIVFVRTRHETEEVAEKLRARGFSAAAINGDIAQNQRERTVDSLKDGRLDILVATDVAARGLDVDRISHVFNFDIPNDTESYVHRIGRTGRAGRTGEAILFVTPRERRMLRSIERVTKATLEEMELPTIDEVNESRTEKFKDQITEALEDPRVPLFRKLVKAYEAEHDTPLEDIAAALAVQSQTDGDFFLKEEPRRDRDRDRGGRDRDRGGRDFDRGGRDRDRGGRDRGGRGGQDRFADRDDLSVYRIRVGKRQGVGPGAIVGALANEGGLTNKDFGRITINGDHSLVELPKDMDKAVLDRLADTRISGQLIEIEHAPDADINDREFGRDRGRGHGG
ncbi:DEAD/DEAH box helicase, partial [Corynebacterium mendelii]